MACLEETFFSLEENVRKDFSSNLELKELKLRTRLCMALSMDNFAAGYFIWRHFLTACIIQGDSGEKINIVAVHCEEISSHESVCNSKWLPRLSCLNTQA